MQNEFEPLAVCLTVEQRSRFDELANRNMALNEIRDGFNQEQWMSDQTEIFWMSEKQRAVMTSIYDTISG